MFQAMRRIVGSLANSYGGGSAFDRAIRQSFLGMVQLEAFNHIIAFVIINASVIIMLSLLLIIKNTFSASRLLFFLPFFKGWLKA